MKRKTKEKYLKVNFEPIVIKSRSLKEVLENLGILCKGGSYATVKKYIKLYDIDVSHFYTKKEMYEKTIGLYVKERWKKNIEEILVENSTYKNTSNLKKKLYRAGLKERSCEECGQDENWREKKIALILDHVNGNPTDNRLENLQILCPNCNAATKTFSRGHKRMKKIEENKNFCSCGKEIGKKSNKCKTCEGKGRIKKAIDFDFYKQLKNDVEKDGFCATGRKYNVSDNTIRKWIKKFENVL